jgi:hypothetical protein
VILAYGALAACQTAVNFRPTQLDEFGLNPLGFQLLENSLKQDGRSSLAFILLLWRHRLRSRESLSKAIENIQGQMRERKSAATDGTTMVATKPS